MNELLSNAFFLALDSGVSTLHYLTGQCVNYQPQNFWYSPPRNQTIFNSDFCLVGVPFPHLTWYYRDYEFVDFSLMRLDQTVYHVTLTDKGTLLEKYVLQMINQNDPNEIFVQAPQDVSVWSKPILTATLSQSGSLSTGNNQRVLWDVTRSLIDLFAATPATFTLSELSGYLQVSNGIHSISDLILEVLLDDTFEELVFYPDDIVTHRQ